MRKLLLSSVAIVAMSASALAADLPRREAAVAPIYVAPIFTWSGFYVGLNAGATFNDNNRRLRPVIVNNGFVDADVTIFDTVFRDSDDDAAFTGGAQIGYNWQFGAFVAGVEADINYRGNGNNNGYDFAVIGGGPYATATRFNYGGHEGGDWFGTLRARLGFALDRTMIYATGGLAFGDTGRTGNAYYYNTFGTPIGGTFVRDGDDTNWGWTLGGGIEHAFSNNWTAKFEYLYVKLDTGNGDLVNLASPNYRFSTSGEDKFHVVRVGLNYKFGGASVASPVLARY